MTRRLAVAVVVLLTFAARAQTRSPVDWIFLVDTSKSMLQNDIFGEVKKSLKTFVAEAKEGDSVAIFRFDRKAELQTSTPVGANRDDLLTIIDDLNATGDRTHLGAAIAKGLERQRNDPGRVSAIVLFTDGKEDVRGIENHIPIPSNIQRALDSKALIFFVSMGEHEPQLRDFPNAQFLEATNAAAIRDVTQKIRFELDQPGPAPPPEPVRVQAPVLPPPPPPEPSLLARALTWLIALAILTILALVARAKLRERNRLEGELEIVKPRIPADAAFVGLPNLKATEVALSSIVPLDALAGSDARLFCRHRNGTKQVCIASSSGSMRVNEVEVPMSELYDADTIRIGDAQLRFNRVGFERSTGEDQP